MGCCQRREAMGSHNEMGVVIGLVFQENNFSVFIHT